MSSNNNNNSSTLNFRKSIAQPQISLDDVSLIDENEAEKRHLKAKSEYINAKISYMQTEEYRFKLIKSKLKAVTRTSALLSGFAMVAMVELTLDYNSIVDDKNPLQLELERALNACSMANLYNLTNSTFATTNPMCKHVQEQYDAYKNLMQTANNVDAKENNKNHLPIGILIIYAIVTCLLVGIHMLALMISTCILPQVEASTIEAIPTFSHLHTNNPYNHGLSPNQHNQTTANSTANNNAGANSNDMIHPLRGNKANDAFDLTNYYTRPSSIAIAAATTTSSFLYTTSKDKTFKLIDQLASPDKQFHRYIELAWISSTVLGIFLFLVEISLVCFIKFYPINAIAAMVGGIFMLPIFTVFVIFTFTFYKRIAGQKINLTKEFINQVDRNLMPLHEQIV